MMQDRLLNGLILLFMANTVWAPLIHYGSNLGFPFNPIAGLIGLGVLLITIDIADYQRTPKLKPIVYGTLLLPFWAGLRMLLDDKKRG